MRGIRVIPVLVEGAPMPPADQLPEDLKPLARRNALSLSHEGFRGDSERLMDSVGEILEAARGEGAPRPPEGHQPPRGRALGPGQTELLPGFGAGSGAPPFNNRTSLKGVIANLQRPRRWLVVLGLGVVACLLGVGLFKATRPPSVSIGGSSSPASPNLALSGADWLAAAKRHLDVKDYAKALPLLQKATEAGNPEAMNNLGVLYFGGHGVVQDYAQAQEWYQKAAEAGNVWGMNNLGYLYENGLGVVRNYAQARQWFQKAADAGNVEAKQALTRLPSTSSPLLASSPWPISQPLPSPSRSGAEWFAEAQHDLDAKDYAQALTLLLKAADAGNADGMCNLGYLYGNGWGVNQDYAQARQWYQKAADAGNALGMNGLGWLYQNGWGVNQDYGKAREWYQKAADAGNALGMCNLGYLYGNGRGVNQNYAQARQWYQKAADAGNALGMNGLGWLYQNGWGVNQDYGKAREWYQKAADAGNVWAMYNLGVLYVNGWGVNRDYAQARQWYQKAAGAGNAYAKQALAQLPSK